MTTSDKQHHPKRMLSGSFTLAVIVGGTIGLGILRTPGEIAAVVPDPVGFVSLWVVGVIILRSRQPDTDRPYRAWGHPWTTYSCLVGWLFISLFQAVAEIHTAAYAAIMVAISWPVYWSLTRSRSK